MRRFRHRKERAIGVELSQRGITMSLRTILLPVTCHDGQNAASRVALNMAKRFKSHITALHVKADPRSAVPFIGEGMTAEVVKELVHATEKESAAKAKDSLGAFTEAATELGVKECDSLHKGAGWSWDESVGHFGERLGRLARVHDVAIVPQPAGGGEHGEGEFLNEALFRSGRPLMMVPKKTEAGNCASVMIAWNGGAEGARAVAAALPILEKAESVIILVIGDENPDRPSASDLALSLARHDINADVIKENDNNGSVAGKILDVADRENTEILVIGAYSHNRWREMVIGGVTREIIDCAPIPVFMSH